MGSSQRLKHKVHNTAVGGGETAAVNIAFRAAIAVLIAVTTLLAGATWAGVPTRHVTR
jgi:hypothetical protein